jgi:hypothetical protein
MAADQQERARVQSLCWLLDELFDAEEDLLELVARPGALVGWRRERLGEFWERVGEGLWMERRRTTRQVFGELSKCRKSAPQALHS